MRPLPRWLIPATLVAASFFLFGPSIGGEYVLDGIVVVRDNPMLAHFDPLRIVTLDWWAGTSNPGGLYRPVALVWLAAWHAVGGASPAWVDFFNVLLHGLVAWARYGLLVRLLGPGRRQQVVAWLAALFALVHPLGVEVVAGQVGASDLFATLFATLAVVVGDSRRPARLILAGALALLGCLSKESAVAVVPLAILFAACKAGVEALQDRRRSVLVAAAWSCAGAAVAIGLRLAVVGSLLGQGDQVYAGFPAVARIASASAVFGTYLAPLVFAPWRQLPIVSLQDVWPATGFGDWRALLGLALLLALALGPIVAFRRGKPAIAFGCWLFLVWWLPTSNLVFSSGAVAASRFLYPGLIGLTLVLALAVVEGWRRRGALRIVSAALAAWLGIAMAIATSLELPAWRSARELNEARVRKAPESPYGLVDLALLVAGDDPARALDLFKRASSVPIPDIPGSRFPPEDLLEAVFLSHSGSARIARVRGDAVRSRSELIAASVASQRGLDGSASLPYREDWKTHKGYALRQLARLAIDRAGPLAETQRGPDLLEAERFLAAAELIEPDKIEIVELRAADLNLRGDFEGRRAFVEKAWRSRPDDPGLRALWATELRKVGRVSEAVAIEIDVAAKSFEGVDLAYALSTALEAVTDASPEVRAKGRQVLGEVARRAPDRATAEKAARALAAARRD